MTFEDFVDARLPALLRFAVVLCVDRGTAQDVVQEVLLRVHTRWDRIEVLDEPDSYVRKMVVNEYLSWRRKWARVSPVATMPEQNAGVDVEGAVTDRMQLISEVAALPPRQRAAVVLRFFADLSDREIASEMGCSIGTVRSHLSRAMASLRVRVNAETEEGSGDRLAHGS